MTKVIKESTLGSNIQGIRTRCGLTQEETVAKLQILGSPLSRSTYALIEVGRGNIYVSDLVGLQMIFKADFAEFFHGIPTAR